MGRAQLIEVAERIFDDWCGGKGPAALIEEIVMQPPTVAAALAAVVGGLLEDVFNEAPAFRAALVARAVDE